MNIQSVSQKWPATAGMGFMEHSAMEALKTQSNLEGFNPSL